MEPGFQIYCFCSFRRWNVAIADVKSGKITDVPGSQISGMKFLAWSADSKEIAFGVDKQLRVLRIDDNKVLLDIQAPGKIWFDYGAAFSDDGKDIFVQTADRTVILNRVDIATGAIEPILSNPVAIPKRSGVNKGHFEQVSGRLYFSLQIDSFVDGPGGTKIVNGTTVRDIRVHPSCYVFGLGPRQEVATTRFVDLTPYAEENIGGSGVRRNIEDCFYSVPADLIVVQRAGPQPIAQAPQDPAKDRLFTSVELGSGKRVADFGSLVGPDNGVFSSISVHPMRPWVIANSRTSLKIWNLLTGEEVADVRGQLTPYKTSISPDGKRVVCWAPYGMLIYRIDE
jgi:hypothetical protein